MDLLTIKTGDRYLRIQADSARAVGLDKASVFPMDRLAHLKTHLVHLRKNGFPDAAIYRLTLTESPLEEETPR